jgi:hypothetical protein
MSKLATIITTFKRPQYLQRAIDSTIAFFGSEHEIIVSSAGYNGEDIEICKDKARLVSYKGDPGGCNSLWLRGVYQTDAEFIHILHDDDYYNELEKDNFNLALDCLQEGVIPLWDGLTHFESNGYEHRIRHLIQDYGDLPSIEASKHLQQFGGLTISPICTLLHRETALNTLKRAEVLLKDCSSRKGMMIGNDLWLHLTNFQKFNKVRYFENMFTVFGHHDGSETAANGNALIKYYDMARNIWKNGGNTNKPNAIHLVHGEMYPLAQRAKNINEVKYDKETVRYEALPEIEIDTQLHTPTINSLVEETCNKINNEDIIVYTNGDIILCDNFYVELKKEFNTCGWSHRINIGDELNIYPRRINYDLYPGADLFAFTKNWWLQNKEFIPTLLIGYEAWDTVFMHRMKFTGGKEIKGLSYHINHQSHWEQPQNRHSDNGQIFNRNAAKDYLIRAGVYNGQYEEGVVECELLAKPIRQSVQSPSIPVASVITARPRFVQPPAPKAQLPDIAKIHRDGLFFKEVKSANKLTPIILALQYYKGDQYAAEKLMRLIADIEYEKNLTDTFLIVHRFDSPAPNPETINHLKTKFANVVIRRGARNVKGHPGGCNALWCDTMVNANEIGRNRRIDFIFTFEADCVPLKQDWIKHLRQVAFDAKRDNIKVTGYLNPSSGNVIEHINGNALFSTKLLLDFPQLLNCPENDPWDLWSVKFYSRHWRGNSFIFNAYRKIGFTDEQFLDLQKKGYALVHGIRDDNGLEFIRKIIS